MRIDPLSQRLLVQQVADPNAISAILSNRKVRFLGRWCPYALGAALLLLRGIDQADATSSRFGAVGDAQPFDAASVASTSLLLVPTLPGRAPCIAYHIDDARRRMPEGKRCSAKISLPISMVWPALAPPWNRDHQVSVLSHKISDLPLPLIAPSCL